jgi:hypothetical protein
MALTEWELIQILGSKLESFTDFFVNGKQLLGKDLQDALLPWR